MMWQQENASNQSHKQDQDKQHVNIKQLKLVKHQGVKHQDIIVIYDQIEIAIEIEIMLDQ